MIRALGLLLGLLLLALPLLYYSSYVDAARANPRLFAAPFIGIFFLAYGIGGKQFLSRWAPRVKRHPVLTLGRHLELTPWFKSTSPAPSLPTSVE